MSSSTERPQSPFLDIGGYVSGEWEDVSTPEASSAQYQAETPFRSVYELEGQTDTLDPQAEEFASFLAELHDRQFDEAVFELVNEAANLYESRFEGEHEGLGSRGVQAERMLERHFTPLVEGAEGLLEALAERVEDRDPTSLSEAELDDFISHYAPVSGLAPNFEEFFGFLKDKLKKVASTGLAMAKRGIKAGLMLGLGPILRKLKPLIKPLLAKVLHFAIRKLPISLQPIAQKLAGRFFQETAEEESALEEGEAASGDIGQIQREFDLELAQLLFAQDPAEQELAFAAFVSEAQQPASDPLSILDQARDRFVDRIGQLREGEDATPVVEEFLPAILPVLKTGIRLIGRERVVNYLAKLLAKLIVRFVGRRYTPVLSQAIVDAGLRLIHLEATPEDEARVAGQAVANTLEETVRLVAASPEYILEDVALLEGFVLEAFESAAASNLPPILSEKVYIERPELRETTGVRGAWIAEPLRGKKYYKKFTRIFDVSLTPHMAQAIRTFGGVPLATAMRNLAGLQGGRSIKARVHLYEAIPGTWLSRISKHEKHVAGLGTAAKSAWSQIHPLTPEAAGMLLSQPGLGREVPEQYLADRLMTGLGQRFYYLEVPEAPALTYGGQYSAANCCQAHLTLDFPRDQIQLYIFLSEAEAQNTAVRLRQQAPIGTVMNGLRSVFTQGLKATFAEGRHHQVKIVHGAMAIEQIPGAALKWVPPLVLEMLLNRLLDWLGRSLSQYLRQQPQTFIAATEDPAVGLTVSVRFSNPPGLPLLRQIFGGEPVALRGLQFPEGMPEAHIHIVPGYWYG